jgi:hypothetical protein
MQHHLFDLCDKGIQIALFICWDFEHFCHFQFWKQQSFSEILKKKKSKYFGSDISLQSLHSSTFKILGSNNSILLDDGCNSLNDSTNSAMCAVCCCRYTFPTVMAEAKQFLTRNDPESLPFSLPPLICRLLFIENLLLGANELWQEEGGRGGTLLWEMLAYLHHVWRSKYYLTTPLPSHPWTKYLAFRSIIFQPI